MTYYWTQLDDDSRTQQAAVRLGGVRSRSTTVRQSASLPVCKSANLRHSIVAQCISLPLNLRQVVHVCNLQTLHLHHRNFKLGCNGVAPSSTLLKLASNWFHSEIIKLRSNFEEPRVTIIAPCRHSFQVRGAIT